MCSHMQWQKQHFCHTLTIARGCFHFSLSDSSLSVSTCELVIDSTRLLLQRELQAFQISLHAFSLFIFPRSPNRGNGTKIKIQEQETTSISALLYPPFHNRKAIQKQLLSDIHTDSTRQRAEDRERQTVCMCVRKRHRKSKREQSATYRHIVNALTFYSL